jgi:cell pole-organizing protein PopZ
MSSFDKTGGKNLDEILASIRKTLADESTQPQPDVPTMKSGVPHAVVQNGAGPKSDKIDDDLADLLAGGLDIPTPAGKPAESGTAADEKDPLWFLRPNEGREPREAPLPADGAASAGGPGLAGAAILPSERASLAPVFIADTAGAVKPPAPVNGTRPNAVQGKAGEARPAGETTPTAKDPENEMASNGAAVDGSSPASPAPLAAGGAPAASKPRAPAEAQGGAKSEMSAAPGATPAKSSPVTPHAVAGPGAAYIPGGATAAPVKPEARQAEARLATKAAAEPQRSATAASPSGPPAGPQGAAAIRAAAAMVHPTAFNGAAVTSPQRAPVVTSAAAAGNIVPPAQAQALEQIIEQLLEPLLQRWVQANLPRLVDAAIRAEVARALEKKAEVERQTERKA